MSTRFTQRPPNTSDRASAQDYSRYQDPEIAFRFTDAEYENRWSLSQRLDEKVTSMISVNSILAGVIYFVLNYESSIDINTYAKVCGYLALLIILFCILYMIHASRLYVGRPFRKTERNRQRGFNMPAMRTTRGIKDWDTSLNYESQLQTMNIDAMIFENIRGLMSLNDVCMTKHKRLRRSRVLMTAAASLLILAVILQEVGPGNIWWILRTIYEQIPVEDIFRTVTSF